jgi:hypothetical protein
VKKRKLPVLILLLLTARITGQSLDPVSDFPVEFKDRAMEHVTRICSFGERVAGTKVATKTIDYIEQEFRKSGLEIEKDTFYYSSFEAKKIAVTIDGKTLKPQQIILDPYSWNMDYTGSFVLFYPDSSLGRQMMQDMKNKIIVTRDPADYYSLSSRSPRAILVLEKADFNALIDTGGSRKGHSIVFRFSGKIKKIQSVNLAGTLRPLHPDSGEILLSAHWDSFNSVGADDNASGLATLIELAKYFSQHRNGLAATMKFVAFGAEEMGTVGAVSYVDHHRGELQHCRLMFNIDCVSGLRDIYIDLTGKVENISPVKGIIKEDLYFRNKALRGKTGNWMWIKEYPMASDVPGWLRQDVVDVCNALYTKINQVSGIGSDHQAFALAGIPSTSITIDNHVENHTSSDTPEKVHPEGMWIAGRIVAGVVVKVLK